MNSMCPVRTSRSTSTWRTWAEGCICGVLSITERYLQRPTVEYLPFVSWDPATEVGELDAFTRFWTWLSAQRSGAASAGRSLYAYCYNKGAENGEMRRIAGA